LEKGDTLYIHDISRSGRNTEEVLGFIRELNEKGVNVHFHKENLDFGGEGCDPFKAAISTMVLTMLSAVHTLFLTNNSSAIKDGMRKAKAKGVKLGAASPKYNRESLTLRNKRVNNKARAWAEKYRTQIEFMVDMGMSLRDMASKLASIGAKTLQGKLYTHNSVNNLCKLLDIDRKTFKLGENTNTMMEVA
ncbi:MAG: recombinase family protein, partial [Colwellia sp.]|nr:recombinase family protein [Colwellia sp.]